MQTSICLKLHLTAALTVTLLALLKLLVQECARLLVSLVVVEAIVKHTLVVTARSHAVLIHTLTLRRHGCLLLRSFLATTAATKASGHGTDSLVRNRRTGTKGHTLRNGATNAREHAATTALGGCGDRRLLRSWSRSASRCRGRARCGAGWSGRAARWGTSSTTTTL